MSTNAYGCLLPHLTRFTIASLHETQPSTPLTQKAPKVRKTSKKRSTLHKRFAGYKEPLAPRLARPEFQLILIKKLKNITKQVIYIYGGEGGIRTREAVTHLHAFERAPSATRTPHHLQAQILCFYCIKSNKIQRTNASV